MAESIMDFGIKANNMDMEYFIRMESLNMDNGIWAREYNGLIENKQKEWKNSII